VEAASITPAVAPAQSTHGGTTREGAQAGEHHGPPAANRSSRVDPQLLGMLLFIISEVMIFGAFFTAYFFIRVAQGDPWPAPGTHLPVPVAFVNTLILVSSSFTLHWAETSIKRGNRFGLKAGMLATFCSAARSCSSRSTSTRTSASPRRTTRSRRSSTRSPDCTAHTCLSG